MHSEHILKEQSDAQNVVSRFPSGDITLLYNLRGQRPRQPSPLNPLNPFFAPFYTTLLHNPSTQPAGPAGPPSLVLTHHLSPSSRGHYGCLAMEPCLCRKHRNLFCPLNRGKSGAARIGGGERSEPVSRMVILPYDTEKPIP